MNNETFSYKLRRDELLNLRQHKLIQGAAYLGFALKIDALLSPNTGLQINVQSFCDRWQISESFYYKSLRRLTKAGIVRVYYSSSTVYLEEFFIDSNLSDQTEVVHLDSDCTIEQSTVRSDRELYDQTENCTIVQPVSDQKVTVRSDNQLYDQTIDCTIGQRIVRSDSDFVRSDREMIINVAENGIEKSVEKHAQSLAVEESEGDSLARTRKIDMGEEDLSVITDRYSNTINTNNNKINIYTNTCVRAHACANTKEEEKSQEVVKESLHNYVEVELVEESPHDYAEVKAIETNPTTPQRSGEITKTSSRANPSLCVEDDFATADENDNYYQTLPENVREIAKRYDASQIAPKGIELNLWANHAIGSLVASYRRSGRILNSNPNDIDIEFIAYMQKQGKKITNIHGWVRNMESDPSRWGELRLFVDGWIKEKFLSSEEGKEMTRVYNAVKGNNLFNSIE